ncbi:MAG: HD domain-containing phosphohydrolase [Terriglobales bacterium]
MSDSSLPTGVPAVEIAGARVLVVDDDDVGRELTAEMLRLRGCDVRTAADCQRGMELFNEWAPDLALVDVVLPDGSGIEMCHRIKQDARTRLVPVMLVTGLTDHDSKIRGIEAGADDFLNKPVDPPELFARAVSLIKLKRYTDELENAEDVLFSLAMGVEARDKYTQGHCQRLAARAAALGRRLGLAAEDVVALRRGGVLHDIGKITVPDAILRKPGGLSPAEWGIMRLHPGSGEEICRPLRSLARVLPIIRHHHEHWNGGGYPDRLAGEGIPLLARILQVVDAYDALTTERPYKPAWPPQRAQDQLRAEMQQGWWDPHIMGEYLAMLASAADPPNA